MVVIDCWGLLHLHYRTEGDRVEPGKRHPARPDLDEAFCDGQHALKPHKWHHVALVAFPEGIQTVMELYIDGIKRSELRLNGRLQMLSGLAVGRGTVEGFEEPFEGSVDEVRLWQGRRTAQQIAAGASQPCRSMSQTKLLLCWDFDESAGGELARDRSGQGRDGHILAGLDEEGDTLPSRGPFVAQCDHRAAAAPRI